MAVQMAPEGGGGASSALQSQMANGKGGGKGMDFFGHITGFKQDTVFMSSMTKDGQKVISADLAVFGLDGWLNPTGGTGLGWLLAGAEFETGLGGEEGGPGAGMGQDAGHGAEGTGHAPEPPSGHHAMPEHGSGGGDGGTNSGGGDSGGGGDNKISPAPMPFENSGGDFPGAHYDPHDQPTKGMQVSPEATPNMPSREDGLGLAGG